MTLSRSSLIKYLVIASIAILGVTTWVWWHFQYSKPSVVFERMLSTMLTTPSVTKTVTQQEGTQKLEQKTQLTLGQTAQVHSRNVLDQGQAVITTESIGTPSDDFIRYNSIETNQKNAAGNDFDFSKILGIWGQSGDNAQTGEEAQLFNQTMLGVVPTASLQPEDRSRLLKQIEKDDVYKVDYANVQRKIVNRRPVYTYQVSVEPVAYINLLKTFSRLVGSNRLDSVDASQYANTETLRFSFEVDVWSSQLTKVTYTDSGRVETYSAYGARVLVDQPEDYITLEELQNRLEQIQ